jgi:hypothetical protein
LASVFLHLTFGIWHLYSCIRILYSAFGIRHWHLYSCIHIQYSASGI